MGDISGKGISAALLMASLHSAVRAYRFAGEDCLDDNGAVRHLLNGNATFSSPGKVLSMLNRHLYRTTQPENTRRSFSRTTTPTPANFSTPTAVNCHPSCSAPTVTCAAGPRRLCHRPAQ